MMIADKPRVGVASHGLLDAIRRVVDEQSKLKASKRSKKRNRQKANLRVVEKPVPDNVRSILKKSAGKPTMWGSCDITEVEEAQEVKDGN